MLLEQMKGEVAPNIRIWMDTCDYAATGRNLLQCCKWWLD